MKRDNNNYDLINTFMWFALVYFLFMWSATTLNAQKLYDGPLYLSLIHI